MKLTHVRISLAEANAFVAEHHRHHKPVVGHLFSLGASIAGSLQPSGRHRDGVIQGDQQWQHRRSCHLRDGSKNACSFLYFKRIGTYILATEPGTSLTAANWRLVGETAGGSWSVPSRPRVDKHPLQRKLLFEMTG